jgi:hypothetical protein
MPAKTLLTGGCCGFSLAGGLDFWFFCCCCFFLAAALADPVESDLFAALSPAPFGTPVSVLFCAIVEYDNILYV